MTDPRFLLDTNICIYLLGGDAQATRARVERCQPGELVTSAIAFAEVMMGAERLKAVSEAEELFRVVTVLAFDAAAARIYAELPFRRGSFDRLIAAHALAAGLVLVTNNERDYRDVAGLRIENWTKK